MAEDGRSERAAGNTVTRTAMSAAAPATSSPERTTTLAAVAPGGSAAPAARTTAAWSSTPVRPGATRARHTPTVLRAAALAVGLVAAAAATAVATTTAERRSDVQGLATSTAAVASETGDAGAAFALAEAQAAALASPGATAATELRYLQAMAAGVNALERAAQLTRLGTTAESPLRRALRSAPVYAAEVARAQDAATAGDTAEATARRAAATATMTGLVRANVAAVSTLHENAVQREAASLHDGRRVVLLLTLVPLTLLVLLLVAVQAWMSARFRRLLNVPLVLATLLSVGVLGRTAQLQLRQSDGLTAAIDGGYAAERSLTDARVLAYETQGRRTAALASGGTGALEPAAAAALRDGVTAASAVAATPERATAMIDAVEGYLTAATSPGSAATESPTRPGTAASRFNVLDGALLTARTDARTAFADAIDDAQHGQSKLLWLGPLVLAAAVALAWLGLQRRLAEYR